MYCLFERNLGSENGPGLSYHPLFSEKDFLHRRDSDPHANRAGTEDGNAFAGRDLQRVHHRAGAGL